MMNTIRSLWAMLRGPGSRGEDRARGDTEYLRSSRVNEARLNAAIGELNAGRGSLARMSDLHARLDETAAR